jgi:hypothetical protein
MIMGVGGRGLPPYSRIVPAMLTFLKDRVSPRGIKSKNISFEQC